FRLGNLLADLVKGRDRASMSPAFLEGVRQHHAIDVFTDAHQTVHRSRARIGGDFPHATGILVDVFYDHFLALDWEQCRRRRWTPSRPVCTPTCEPIPFSCPRRRERRWNGWWPTTGSGRIAGWRGSRHPCVECRHGSRRERGGTWAWSEACPSW